MNISAVGTTTQTTTTGSADTLSPDSFMTLLIAQLRTQDPTSPMDTTAMVNQLATMQMVSESRATRQSQEFTEATNLIGKQVTWQNSATGGAVTGSTLR